MGAFGHLPLPRGAQEAIARLESAGYEAFAVGGAVRDALLHRPAHDVDLAVSSTPEETARVFAGERLRFTGAAHGTVTLSLAGEPLELTTYRVDGGYSDGRRPDRVRFTPSLAEDLRRRDFTVNAIAYRPSDGFRDPCGGLADFSDRLLRPIGEARARFSEDALRILRAFRFQAQLGFSLVPESLPALAECAPGLGRVAAERITDELSKLLLAGQPDDALLLMQRLGVLPDFLPQGDIPPLAASPARLPLRLALLFSPMETAGAAGRLARLRLPRDVLRDTLFLLERRELPPPETPAGVKRRLREFEPERFALLCDFRLHLPRADAQAFGFAKRAAARVALAGECWSLAQLAVQGDELKALGLRGPEIGAALDCLLEAVVAGECPNERIALLEKWKENPGKGAKPLPPE